MDRKELIEQNLGLVHACANRFRGRGIEYEELYSAGCLGLVKAADGFREELGFAFSTYAVPAVLGEIRRLFRDGGAVKVSRSLKERSREAVKLSEKLTKENGREPTVTELSKILGIDCFAVSELLNISLPPVSLYLYTWSGSPAIASARILTQLYTAVICMADVSVTILPLVVPPKKKLYRLPLRLSFGLSRDRNKERNGFIWTSPPRFWA